MTISFEARDRHLTVDKIVAQKWQAFTSLLSSRVHLLLRRHGIRALLGSLLLLEIRLILERLLLVGRHVWLLGLVAGHALWLHVVWHWRWGGVLLLRRLDRRAIAINVVGIGGLGCIQAGLESVSRALMICHWK